MSNKVVRHKVNSCCGGQAYVFQTSNAVTRHHLEQFKKEGWKAPPHFERVGVFCVELKGLMATCSFGSNRINVRASTSGATQMLSSFQVLLERFVG